MAAARRALAAALALALVPIRVSATQLPVRPADAPPAPAGLADNPCSGHPEDKAAYLPRLLRVVVNGADTRQEYFFVQRHCGALLARARDLRELRIRAEGKPRVDLNGQPYVNLNSYEGLTYKLDEARQRIEIDGEPRIFYPTVINLEHDRVPRTAIAPGGFLNYGLFTADRLDGGARNWTGTATLGVFGEPGVLVSDWLYFHQSTFDRTLRLGTTFFDDFPDRISSLRVGDVYSRGGAFGSTAAVGGVQYATNFSTRPYLITSPVEMMDAATRRLAVVDLFNSDLESPERQSRAAFLSGLATAPHGPVEIVNIPTYQNGEYVLMLRDAQGRETEVRRKFFFSQGLLRQGLSDFSYEAGLRRESFLADSYRGAFVSGTHRYGYSQRLTLEAHAEAAEGAEALGLTMTQALPHWGVLTATAAGSRTGGAAGAFGALGLENSYAEYGYALRTECRSDEFFLPAAGAAPNPLACREFVSGSKALSPYDSVSLSAAAAQLRGQPDTRSYRLGYVTRRWRGLTLNAFASYADQPFPDYSVGLLASASLATVRELAGTPREEIGAAPRSLLDPRRVNFQLTAETGRNRDLTAIGRVSSGARIDEQDYGVQASAGLLHRDLQTLSGSWSNRYLTSAAGVSRVEGQDFYTAGAASGIVWMDHAWFPTAPVTASFAAVRLGSDYQGVRVNGYRTDADGDVLLSPMQPYRDNPVAINGSDLPMNARFNALTLGVTPRFRSGSVLRPRIELVRDAILTVRLRDDSGALVPLPPGAYATVPGSKELFATGEDGAVYVSGLAATTTIAVHWNDQHCAFDVTLPAAPAVNEIPELGPFVCEGVKP